MKALDGIKIVDLTWSVAGPLATKLLADHGATVIHVETAAQPDFLRVSGPYKDKIPGIDRSGYFAFFGANKYSIALNLKHEKAGTVIRRLLQWGDVIVDNFTPGVMARLGLDYEAARMVNPEVITLSISQMGQTGPLRNVSGTGTNLVGMTGFTAITGSPGMEPVQPFGGYPDFISGPLGVCALMAALFHRRETGQGQAIEVSQLEAALQFLTSSILSYAITGNQEERMGNRTPDAAPNGIYPCKGYDRWCAISVQNELDWKRFCEAIGTPIWTQDKRFASLLERKANEDELDRLVGQWTLRYSAEDVMESLQRHSVAAGVVQNPADLVQDPQLIARDTFWRLNHREIGNYLHLGTLFHLPLTPATAKQAAPCLGEHTEYVCCKLLNMPDEEFTELLLDGVFT